MSTIKCFPENELLETCVSQLLKSHRQVHDDYLIIDCTIYNINKIIVNVFDHIDSHYAGFNGVMLVLYQESTEKLAKFICSQYARELNIVLMNSHASLDEFADHVLHPYAYLMSDFSCAITWKEYSYLRLFYEGDGINEIAEITGRKPGTIYSIRSSLVKKVFGDAVRTTKRLWPPVVS